MPNTFGHDKNLPVLPKDGQGFFDIRSTWWTEPDGPFAFLRMFRAHLLCYWPDGESDNLPVIHTFGVDGLTPKTIAYPDPSKQSKGYAMGFSVNGFKNASHRTKDNLYCVNGHHVDIDWPNKDRVPTHAELLEFKSAVMQDLAESIMASEEAFKENPETADMPPAPTAIVETKNGFHVYWMYQEPILLDSKKLEDPETRQKFFKAYEGIQTAITERYQGDPVARDVTRVLRLPGSYHKKDPGNPYLVKLVRFEPTAKYKFSEMRRFWLLNPKATEPVGAYAKAEEVALASRKATSPRKVKSSLNAMFESATSSPELTDDEWKDVNKDWPKMERPSTKSLMAPSGIKPGTRNKCLLMAASAMREDGQTEIQVLEFFLKQGYNGLSDYEIKQTVRSAFKGSQAYVFGWNDPILAQYVTLEEQSHLVKLIKGIREKKKQPEVPTTIGGRTLAQFGAPEDYLELGKEIKKNIYDHFEIHFFKEHPEIVNVETVGFFRRMENGAWHEPVSEDWIKGEVNRMLYKSGLADMRGTSQITSKIEALKAFTPMTLTREASEQVLFTKPGEGTFLNLKNGILDLDTGNLIPRNPNLFFTHAVDADPGNAEPPERFLKFVREVCDAQGNDVETDAKIALMQEMMGYCLTPYTHFQRAFILYGPGANGKSTFLKLLQRLLGPENASARSLTDITRQFGLKGIYRRRVNIIEEISDNYFQSDILKKIVSGEMITADRKFKDEFDFFPTCKLVLAVNRFPKVNDTSMALYRRFIVIPFDRIFKPGEKDPMMGEKLWEERNGILKWAMEGWQRLMKNEEFTTSKAAQDGLDEFKEGNSPIVEHLLNSFDLLEESSHEERMHPERWRVPIEQAYEGYRDYVGRRGYALKSFRTFQQECQTLSHRRLHGVNIVKMVSGFCLQGIRSKTTGLPQFTRIS